MKEYVYVQMNCCHRKKRFLEVAKVDQGRIPTQGSVVVCSALGAVVCSALASPRPCLRDKMALQMFAMYNNDDIAKISSSPDEEKDTVAEHSIGSSERESYGESGDTLGKPRPSPGERTLSMTLSPDFHQSSQYRAGRPSKRQTKVQLQKDYKEMKKVLEQTAKPKGVFDPFEKDMMHWDKAMGVLLVFVAVVTPFQVRRRRRQCRSRSLALL